MCYASGIERLDHVCAMNRLVQPHAFDTRYVGHIAASSQTTA